MAYDKEKYTDLSALLVLLTISASLNHPKFKALTGFSSRSVANAELVKVNPEKFFQSLRKGVEVGPRGPPANMGTLHYDPQKLEAYLRVVSPFRIRASSLGL